MAEGRHLNPAQRAEEVQKILEAFGRAVEKLKQIGLTHKSAVRTAGEMFDIRLDDGDITDEPPEGSTVRRVA